MTTTAPESDRTRQTPSGPAARHRDAAGSRGQAWFFVALFFFVINGVGVLYWAADTEISGGQTLLLRALAIVVFWKLLEAECRPYRVTYPLDMAFFLYATNFLLLPYYFWRTQRWRDFGECLLVAALWTATFAAWQLAAWLVGL